MQDSSQRSPTLSFVFREILKRILEIPVAAQDVHKVAQLDGFIMAMDVAFDFAVQDAFGGIFKFVFISVDFKWSLYFSGD